MKDYSQEWPSQLCQSVPQWSSQAPVDMRQVVGLRHSRSGRRGGLSCWQQGKRSLVGMRCRCVLRLEVEEGSRSKEPQVSRSPQRDGRLTEVSGSGGTELARSGKVLPGLTGLAHERRRNHYFWNTILIWLPLGSVARQISRSNWVRMGLSLWDQLSAEAPCPAGQEHLCVGLRHSGDSTPSHYSSEGPVTPISSAKYFSKCPGTTTLDRGCPSSRSPM